MKTKIFLALGIALTVCTPIFAQVSFVPNGAHRFSIGIGGGVARLYGDLPKRSITPVGKLNAEYKILEYLSVGVEGQIGTLQSGVKSAQPDPIGRYSRNVSWGLYSLNNFQAANLYGRVAVGQFTEENEDLSLYIKAIYAGVGVGAIRNTITDIVQRYPENKEKVAGIVTNSIGVVIPVNAGINMDIPNTNISGNFNIQYNFSMSEGLDGYNFSDGGFAKDGYLLISLGVKYNFGPLL